MSRLPRALLSFELSFALVAAPFLGGCTAPRITSQPLPPEVTIVPGPKHTKYQTHAELKREGPHLVVVLEEVTRQERFRQTVARREEVTEKREWQVKPGFFMLPLYPVQMVAGLAGATLLVANGFVTAVGRAAIGSALTLGTGIPGVAVILVQIPLGLVGTTVFLALNPLLIKWPVAGTLLVAGYLSLIPAAIDSNWQADEKSVKPLMETIMLPLNLDTVLIGNLLYRRDSPNKEERYLPYAKVTVGEFFGKTLGAKWVKGIQDTWDSTVDFRWIEGSFFKAAGGIWEWAWDFESHFITFGLKSREPGQPSALARLLRMIVYVEPYSLLPVKQDGPWRVVRREEFRSPATLDPLPDQASPPVAVAIRQLDAAIGVKGGDAEEIPYKYRASGSPESRVRVPLRDAIDTFCHDDDLIVKYTVVGARGPEQLQQGVSELIPVKNHRPADGPRIRWLTPSPVRTGRGVVNSVPAQEFEMAVHIKADTAGATITFWEIRQGISVLGTLTGNFGRQVTVKPAGGRVRLPSEGKTAIIEVEAKDSSNGSSTAVAAFLYSRKK